MAERLRAFGISIDALDMAGAVQRLIARIDEGAFACHYVVTPNVDHLVKLDADPEFRAAYAGADLVVVDGKPVLAALRALGWRLPGTVPGSDLVPALFDASAQRGTLRVFLLGAAEGVAERAARAIEQRWSHVQVVGCCSPALGFSAAHPSTPAIVDQVAAARPDLLVVGLGAPRQELWIRALQPLLKAHVALCVGATIDFLAGEKRRAPVWMRRLGLEWLHRILTEPRRLFARYVRDAWIFPRLIWREWRKLP